MSIKVLHTQSVRSLRLLCLVLLTGSILSATPLIFTQGILNSAAFTPPGAPGGAIARGSVFTIFGRDLGPAIGVQVSSFPLGEELAGVSITVTQGEVTVNAIPLFVVAGQSNAIMPSSTPVGWVSIRVTFNGETSNPSPVRVVDHAPGIFTVNQFGIGPGVLQNFVSAIEQPINSTTVTARPGQLVTIWLTGLGPIEAPDNEAPPVGTLPFEVEVFIGGVQATGITYAGRTPCCSGVDQINVPVPENAPAGCFTPVQLRVGGVAVSNTVTMAVDRDGGACSDVHNPFSAPFVSGARMGSLLLVRHEVSDQTVPAKPVDFIVDQLLASFSNKPGGPFVFDPDISWPPPGSCTAYNFRGDILEDAFVPFTPAPALDAGAISVSSAGQTIQATDFSANVSLYGAVLGHNGNIASVPARALFLEPGQVQVAGAGGGDVGAFESTIRVAGPVMWTNREQIDTVVRSEGVRLSWSSTNAQVLILGISVDYPTNSSGVFACVARRDATFFDVPDYILANMPASRISRTRSVGFLVLVSIPTQQSASFEAEGLNFGAVLSATTTAKGVLYR